MAEAVFTPCLAYDIQETSLQDAASEILRTYTFLASLKAGRSLSWRVTAAATVLSPSELNFRANIYGMKSLGVERIISA